MNRDALDAGFQVPSPVTAVDLVVAPGHADDVQAALDKEMGEPFLVEEVADAELQLSRAQAGFAGIASRSLCSPPRWGAFLVANAQAMTLGERTRGPARPRAAGATRRQLLALFLRQGWMSSFGSRLGVAGGIVSRTMIGFLRSTRAVLVAGLPCGIGLRGRPFGYLRVQRHCLRWRLPARSAPSTAAGHPASRPLAASDCAGCSSSSCGC